MPRDGSNVYSAPAGTTATSGTTIESAKYNALVADLVTDANLARPVVVGGTGASTAAAALVNLGLTATAAEINILDGATVTTAELNVLDGIPATLTATELGYVDGVTSAIQTQLNAKQATITTLPLANGGTGAALVDPNADRILFWDDSAGAVTFLEAGSGLSITGTTLASTSNGATLLETLTMTGTLVTMTQTFSAGKSYLFEYDGVQHNGGVNRILNVALYGVTDAAYSTARESTTGFNTERLYGEQALMFPMRSTKYKAVSGTNFASSVGASTSDGTNFTSGRLGAMIKFGTAQSVSAARFSLDGAGSFTAGSIKVWEF